MKPFGLRKRDLSKAIAEVGIYVVIACTLVVLPFSVNGLI